MPGLTKENLILIGFADVGAWLPSGETIAFKLDGKKVTVNDVLVDTSNALYAFVQSDAVQYIGKTTQSVRKRFSGYRNPGAGQRTNLRCNAKIKEVLSAGGEVRILVFTPIPDLRYGDYNINLAAGLEDSLIKVFDPPWNGRDKGKPVTEEAERERAEEEVDVGPAEIDRPQKLAAAGAAFPFEITLGQAYYHQGLINPGIKASQHLGEDGEPIQISFDDGTEPVTSSINRKANANGAVRVVGRNRLISEWLQQHYKVGDVVLASVLDPNRIRLSAPS
ncbi:GIY-YIG nuclease family protein [Methylobacterium sp. 88A]|uniref:GIY-YIG nuclease family protein n=1 Tax=Methylobacterium sp. 88A TaxID=1131813 RepID=UPI000377ADCA|nr:GIY-YIG nuclease family protein [Methylobacterium sp. 88A]